MKLIKRTVSIILSILMLISVFVVVPMVANAEEDEIEIPVTVNANTSNVEDFRYVPLKEDKDNIIITKYTGCDSEVVIPEMIDGRTVTEIADYAFSSNDTLTSVSIPDTVTSIGREAFCECSNLDSITIPLSVKEIEYHAFGYIEFSDPGFDGDGIEVLRKKENFKIKGYRYSIADSYAYANGFDFLSLGTAEFDSSVFIYEELDDGTVEITDYIDVFYPEIIIPSELYGKKVSSIGKHAFEDKRFQSVVISDGITSIGSYAFYDCKQLTKISIPASVTSIGEEAFSKCKKLIEIILPEGLKKIGDNAFYKCKSLKRVSIPASVTTIGDEVFFECSNLTEIILSNEIKKTGYGIFSSCYNLRKLTVEGTSSGKLSKISGIFENRFRYLTSLSIGSGINNIDVSSLDNLKYLYIGKNVKKIKNDLLNKCVNIKNIIVDEENKYFSSKDGALYNKNYSKLLRYSPSNTAKSFIVPKTVNSIDDFAFLYCKKLRSITIPNSVKTIKRNAFEGCILLKKVKISSLKSWLNCDFKNYYANPLCNGAKLYLNGKLLTVLKIPKGTKIIRDYSFLNCQSINKVTIPKSVTRICNYAFNGCKKISKIIISNGVKKIGECAFVDCKRLSKINIPKSVKTIPFCAFKGCKSLSKIRIPKNVKKIGAYAFFESGIQSFEPKSDSLVIDYFAFASCQKLKKVKTHGKIKIGLGAFASCKKLSSFTLGNKLKWGSYSEAFYLFDNCSSLKKIYYSGSKTEWEKVKTYSFMDDYYIVCNDGTINPKKKK